MNRNIFDYFTPLVQKQTLPQHILFNLTFSKRFRDQNVSIQRKVFYSSFLIIRQKTQFSADAPFLLMIKKVISIAGEGFRKWFIFKSATKQTDGSHEGCERGLGSGEEKYTDVENGPGRIKKFKVCKTDILK